jgi:hypothetical protein
MVPSVNSYRTGSSLRLYPWKDDLESILLLLEEEEGRGELKTVYVMFEKNKDDDDDDAIITTLGHDDVLALFDVLANELPKLESVIIKSEISSSSSSSFSSSSTEQPVRRVLSHPLQTHTKPPPPIMAVPPIPALTSLLRGENKMKYLTLIGLSLLGDDYDVNGLTEAVRIHRGLHSFVMKNCVFERARHLQLVRTALGERRDMKHCDLLDNAERRRERQPNLPPKQKRRSRFLLLLLFFFFLAMVVVLVVVTSSSSSIGMSLGFAVQKDSIGKIKMTESLLTSWRKSLFATKEDGLTVVVVEPNKKQLPGVFENLFKKFRRRRRNEHQ